MNWFRRKLIQIIPCKHDWEEGRGPHLGHRDCRKCGKHEMAFENRPGFDLPTYEWK